MLAGEDCTFAASARWPAIAIDKDPSSSTAQGLLHLLLDRTSEQVIAVAGYCRSIPGAAAFASIRAGVRLVRVEGPDRDVELVVAGDTVETGRVGLPIPSVVVLDSTRLTWAVRRDGEGVYRHTLGVAGASEGPGGAFLTCSRTLC